jgi:hypothetical protein
MAQPMIAADPLELLTPEDEFAVGRDDQGRVRISPTDVSQFFPWEMDANEIAHRNLFLYSISCNMVSRDC